MSPWQQRARAIIKRTTDGARVAEIGYGGGKLARTLAAERPSLRMVLVDSFLSADEQPERYIKTRDNFAARTDAQVAHAIVEAQKLAHSCGWDFLWMDSVDAAGIFADGEFDLVFIDADHSYEGVKRDIQAWLPKVRGYIGGHDYANEDPRFDFSGVKRAVDEAFGDRVELDGNFTWWVKV